MIYGNRLFDLLHEQAIREKTRNGECLLRRLSKGLKMAPEEGLEPSTPRLTAACSTIELLWNTNGRTMYKPELPPSISFHKNFGATPSQEPVYHPVFHQSRPAHQLAESDNCLLQPKRHRAISRQCRHQHDPLLPDDGAVRSGLGSGYGTINLTALVGQTAQRLVRAQPGTERPDAPGNRSQTIPPPEEMGNLCFGKRTISIYKPCIPSYSQAMVEGERTQPAPMRREKQTLIRKEKMPASRVKSAFPISNFQCPIQHSAAHSRVYPAIEIFYEPKPQR